MLSWAVNMAANKIGGPEEEHAPVDLQNEALMAKSFSSAAPPPKLYGESPRDADAKHTGDVPRSFAGESDDGCVRFEPAHDRSRGGKGEQFVHGGGRLGRRMGRLGRRRSRRGGGALLH